MERVYNFTVKKVTNDYETMNFNTAISQMMIFINTVTKSVNNGGIFPVEYAEGFLKLLNPVAPHITEELWAVLGHTDSIAYENWPEYDEAKTVSNEITLPIQFNGKLKQLFKLKKMKMKIQLKKKFIMQLIVN